MSSMGFCVKSSDHHSLFINSVHELYDRNCLTDVTLSCGSRFFSAHKLVLSVCSSYFAGLFIGRDGRAPVDNRATVVYLKDVDSHYMEMLLSYMYHGEVCVREDELGELLSTAKSLHINGLVEDDDLAPSGGAKTSGSANDVSASKKRKMQSSKKGIKSEPLSRKESSATGSGEDVEDENDVDDDESLDGSFDGSLILKHDGDEKGFTRIANEDDEDEGADDDGETDFGDDDPENISVATWYECEICYKSFPTTTRLRRHKICHSNLRPFICLSCNAMTYSRFDSLQRHIKKCGEKYGFSREQTKKMMIVTKLNAKRSI